MAASGCDHGSRWDHERAHYDTRRQPRSGLGQRHADGGDGRCRPPLRSSNTRASNAVVTTPAGLTMSTQIERYVDVRRSAGLLDPLSVRLYDRERPHLRNHLRRGDAHVYDDLAGGPRVDLDDSTRRAASRARRSARLTPVDFTYDAQGRLTTTTQRPRQSTIAYDAAGRPSIADRCADAHGVVRLRRRRSGDHADAARHADHRLRATTPTAT